MAKNADRLGVRHITGTERPAKIQGALLSQQNTPIPLERTFQNLDSTTNTARQGIERHAVSLKPADGLVAIVLKHLGINL